MSQITGIFSRNIKLSKEELIFQDSGDYIVMICDNPQFIMYY